MKIQTIPNDAIVELPISGTYHGRLINTYMVFAKKFSNEKFVTLVKAIKDGKISDLPDGIDRSDASALETLMILINELETKFKDEGKMKSQEVEIPTED